MTAGVLAAAVCLLAAAMTPPVGAAHVRDARRTAFSTADDGCDAARTAAKLDFKLKDLRGAAVKLADFKGKVILLNFWATWCAPCKAEIPDFVDLHARYAEAGLQVLGVSADDTPKQLKPFVDALKMNYPVLQGRGQNAVLDAYAISTLPVTVIIGRDGTICRRYTAPVAKDLLERQIKSLLSATREHRDAEDQRRARVVREGTFRLKAETTGFQKGGSRFRTALQNIL